MSKFTYDVLDHSAPSVRLLRVLPPSPDIPGMVQYQLKTVGSLQTNYYAVSYVWNPVDEHPRTRDYTPSTEVASYPILVNGAEFAVRQNLGRFLELARDRYADADLWIDAICINQSSISERNHQAQQMVEVYRNATEVLSWLGPSDPRTDAFLDFFNRLHLEPALDPGREG